MTRMSFGRFAGFLFLLVVLVLSTSCGVAYAQASGASKYFRLMVTGDASNSAVIAFDANSTRIADHIVHYGTEDHGREAKAYPLKASPAVIHDYKGMNNAFVRLSQLRPDTRYYFVVSDPKGVSARFWFKTSSDQAGEKLSVIAGGDSRNNRTPRRNANLLVAKLRADVVLFGGDMTGGGSSSEWSEWFEDWQLTIAKDGRMTPVVVARGNHESSNEMIEKLFDTPKGVYYASSFGGSLLRVYTLNSESGISGEQTTWLQSDLEKNSDAVWKFAQYHKPMRPHTAGKGDGSSQYRSWASVFHKYRMNLVSESDAHVVKSTWPLRPSTSGESHQGFVRDDREGTVYIGEGGWGAPLRSNNDDKPWTRNSGRFNHINLIFLDKSKAEVRFIRTDNAADVEEVQDSTRFRLPKALDVWNPSNGAILQLEPGT